MGFDPSAGSGQAELSLTVCKVSFDFSLADPSMNFDLRVIVSQHYFARIVILSPYFVP